MKNSPPSDDVRLVRLPVPSPLLREIDELVRSGLGGYETRVEVMLDALQNHVLEVKYGAAEGCQRPLLPATEPEPTGPASANGGKAAKKSKAAPAVPTAISNGERVPPLEDLSQTELHLAKHGAVLNEGLAVVKHEPVFGLHNRDYPSIWAAHALATETENGPVSWEGFLANVTAEAWRFAESIRPLEETLGYKLRALYPTNFSKPQSAEEGFRAFGVGSIAKRPRDDGKLDASGPLFSWGSIQVTREDEVLQVGLTSQGYELLEALNGLSLRWPHEGKQAEAFLAFLRDRAPWDWSGFERLLELVANLPTRVELAQQFKEWRPTWSDAMANTNAAGFVARAREWGLLEPKLIDGHYALTEMGEAQRAGVKT
ncbi:MAG: ribbon-helix-helix domain-containing protein [Actinomycetota bacterium]